MIEYASSRQEGGLGRAVVGGYIYRGEDLPQFRGRYVFGDWSRSFFPPSGSLFLAKPRNNGLWQMQPIQLQGRPDGQLGHYLLAFGQDLDGELYVLTSDSSGPSGSSGQVYRLLPPGNRAGR